MSNTSLEELLGSIFVRETQIYFKNTKSEKNFYFISLHQKTTLKPIHNYYAM